MTLTAQQSQSSSPTADRVASNPRAADRRPAARGAPDRTYGRVMDALVADGEAEPGKKEDSGPVPITVVGPPTRLDVSQGDGEGTTTTPTTPTTTPTPPPAPTSYKVVANFAFAGTIQPGGSSSPFGVMNPTISLENCTASTTGDTITIAGTIKGLFEYAWNAGSCVDVPNATASVVTTKVHQGTKKVWEQIRDDLMPSSASPHKSPRDAFWSEALTIRHEKFHATDFHDWVKNTGKADLVSFLGAKTPAAKDNATLGGLLGDAKSNLVTKMFQYYLGGASDPGHSNRAGEITAYADGKPIYKALAEGVEAHGKELEKKEAEEKAKTAPPSGGSTPPTTPPSTPPSGGNDGVHDAFAA